VVFGLWGPWDDETEGSTSKMNGMEVISGPGDDLELLDKSLFRIVFCTEDGGSLLKDHTYAVDTAAEAFIDISVTGVHTHSGANDGGGLLDIYSGNSLFNDLNLCRTTDIKKASWIETVTSTGTAEDATDGTTGERSIRLRPNGTSGAASSISYPTLKVNFGERSFFQCKLRIETATSVALHAGVNCDFVTDVDSNTVKYNAEVCTVTNSNWNLRTASGTNKTSSDTGTAITTNRVAIRIEHYPDLGVPEVDMYIDAAAVFQKTSDIPTSGASAANNIIKHSIKNSTAADRPIHVYPSRLVYMVSDNWV
jgi:hypothetical protein